jgi:hypothetical protein
MTRAASGAQPTTQVISACAEVFPKRPPDASHEGLALYLGKRVPVMSQRNNTLFSAADKRSFGCTKLGML